MARDLKRNLAVAQDLEEDTRTVELRLQPGLSVLGRVESVAGAPLTNATLQLFFWVGNMGTQFDNKPIRADAQGKFAVHGLPAGRRFSMSATARGYGSHSQQIQTTEDDTKPIELEPFVLNVADRKLAGQVVDADDKPVASAYVHIYGQGQP